jgi:hypothetical protein
MPMTGCAFAVASLRSESHHGSFGKAKELSPERTRSGAAA